MSNRNPTKYSHSLLSQLRHHPWAVGVTLLLVVVAVLGFLVVNRYQPTIRGLVQDVRQTSADVKHLRDGLNTAEQHQELNRYQLLENDYELLVVGHIREMNGFANGGSSEELRRLASISN